MKTESNTHVLTPEATLRQITETNSRAPELLKSIGLNPEKYANQTLRQVCAERQWSEMELLKWIKEQDGSNSVTHQQRHVNKSDLPTDAGIKEICSLS